MYYSREVFEWLSLYVLQWSCDFSEKDRYFIDCKPSRCESLYFKWL